MSGASKTFWTDRSDVKIDSTTGMPEVPQGYFWEIKKSSNEFDYVILNERIEVVRSKAWVAFSRFFGVKLGPKYRIRVQESTPIKISEIEDERGYKIAAINKAYYILSEEKQRVLAQYNTVDKIRNKYYGAYPPKTMIQE